MCGLSMPIAAATEVVEQIPFERRVIDFGIVYSVQWGSYVLLQRDTIVNYGSFSNWTTYPFRPHFDKDGIGYNLFGHVAAGQYYYLFYRARGYSKPSAMAGVILSGIAYEFTVETVTEPPSFQDLYQTPILGSAVGVAFETASDYLWLSDAWPAQALAVVLNPFRVFRSSESESPKVSFTPLFSPVAWGAGVLWHF